jgi:formimidoylglutamate deiminase
VIAAAADAGIRIALLNVCYATGAIGEPLRAEQRRFGTPSLDLFMEMTNALRRRHLADATVSVGVAPHSIRAVPREWLPELLSFAASQDMPFHMHVSEQTGEVTASVRAYGLRPVELLYHDELLDPRFTGVHATHINDDEVRMLAETGAAVCACPATERDLGDGFLRARDLVRAGVRIAIGTDSQITLDMLEDARLIEYHERLQRRERVVLTHRRDERLEVAPQLLRMASVAGARSLQLPAGALEAGALADIVAIDLEHLTLVGWTTETLAALLTLSAPASVVRDVWVGGRAVVTDRSHQAEEDSIRDFNHAARRVFASA